MSGSSITRIGQWGARRNLQGRFPVKFSGATATAPVTTWSATDALRVALCRVCLVAAIRSASAFLDQAEALLKQRRKENHQ